MTTKQVQKWSPADWNRKVTYAMPSDGGSAGVAFVWTTPGANSTSQISTASFVIKPIQGSATATKFAEDTLTRVLKAVSPNSEPILRQTPAGQALINKLLHLKQIETDAAIQQRWGEVIKHYTNADTFLIQDLLAGTLEFGVQYRKANELGNLLNNRALMENLGKLFAADAFIGNGDRLFKVNAGNIIFKPSGTLYSIDSTAVLTSFEHIKRDVINEMRVMYNPSFDSDGTSWLNTVVGKEGGLAVPSKHMIAEYAKGKGPILPPSFGLELLFDLKEWWQVEFRGHLEYGLRNLKNPLPSPADQTWDSAEIAFNVGVKAGLKEVDSLLSGFNWFSLKSRYSEFQKRYGADANLDWTNLKLRRLYIKARMKGATAEQAIELAKIYVYKKLPDA